MHSAICNEIFKDRSWDRTRRYDREVGYQALEIAPLTFAPRVADLDADRRRETRDTAKAAGIAMFGLRR